MAHYDSSPVLRCSVWIRPDGEARHALNQAMRIAHERGGGPRFEPHLTLLSGSETTQAEAALKLKHLAARVQPFVIELSAIEWRDDYFRSLYVAVVPSAELTAARQAAYDAFEMNPPPPCEPHVSLLYGNQNEGLKRELAAAAGGRLDLTFSASAVQLVNASSGVPVTAWKTLAERVLGR